MAQKSQPALSRRCGRAYLYTGLCLPCYRSQRRFGGHCDVVFRRVCGSLRRLVVHRDRPGEHTPDWLISLCAACHARVLRLWAVRRWVPEPLLPLWAEQHPGCALQPQLPLYG